jgi:DNA ligase-1
MSNISKEHLAQYSGIKVAADWIYDLERSNSRIQKKKIIEKALMAANLGSANAQCFLFNCYQAYNPFYVFNIRQVPETKDLTNKLNPWPKFWALCESLRTRSISGNVARHQIEEISQEFDSDEWNSLARRVLLKDLRCGITEKTLNDVLAKTTWAIPVFNCQLANDQQKLNKNLKGKRRLEVKLDGVRVLAVITQYDDVQLLSRNGKQFNNFEEIEQEIIDHIKLFKSQKLPFELRGSFVLDGEVVGENFQQLMKQAHRKYDKQTTDMTYYIFDVIPMDAFMEGRWNIPQQARSEFLEYIGNKIDRNKKIKIMPGLTVDFNSDSAQDILSRFTADALDQGHEGIMIKDNSAAYVCSRSNNWIKWKPVESFDLTIVGFEEGTGRNQGRLGALICEGLDQDRKIHVNVGSGFSDASRDEFWNQRQNLLGQIVEICADAVTQNQDGTYSLRFPRFHRFRDDKS